MKKSLSVLLSIAILVGMLVGSMAFSASALGEAVTLSNKISDYTLLTESDKASQQGDKLVINTPGYISNYQLNGVAVKDIELTFNIQFEEITATAGGFIFEVSVRNQTPAKYLWEKYDSYSLKFEKQTSGGKDYLKAYMKKNQAGADDGGFGVCDNLIEIVDGKTNAAQVTFKAISEGTGTRFTLIVDGVTYVDTVKAGYDIPAGVVTINTSKCKTIIGNSVPVDPSSKLKLSTNLQDWTLYRFQDHAVQVGSTMVLGPYTSTTHDILKNVSKRDLELRFKVKFDQITQSDNATFFELAFRNTAPTTQLWQRAGFLSMQFCPLTMGDKKYVKFYFRDSTEGQAFGVIDNVVEIIDGSTPEMDIVVSAINDGDNVVMKFAVDGVELINTVKTYNRPEGAIVLETLRAKVTLSEPPASADETVTAEIDALPEPINYTPADQGAFLQAYNAYQALSASEKVLVLNYAKLEEIMTKQQSISPNCLGATIRTSGKQGLRFGAQFDFSASEGSGYTVKEYGTLLLAASKWDGSEITADTVGVISRSNQYVTSTGSSLEYSVTVVDFTPSQYALDIVSRSFIIYEKGTTGETVTVYEYETFVSNDYMTCNIQEIADFLDIVLG
ncbi:MAG: hypothetical protein PHV32_11290 [Eubacteriales bacterium]|nr:hypothetical protein [Eubacteriales bacterium]